MTVTLGLAALIYAVFEVPESGLASTVTFGATGTLLLICFVVAERRSSAPLVPLRVFTTRPVVFPNAAIFLQSMIGLSWLYVLTLYFQEVLGHGPLAAGLLFATMNVSSVPAALVAGRLVTRFGVKPTATGGLLLVGAGLLLMARMSKQAASPSCSVAWSLASPALCSPTSPLPSPPLVAWVRTREDWPPA